MRWRTANKRRKRKETAALCIRLAKRLREALYKHSPEQTGVWYCPHCRNKTNFIGVDEEGYGGPEVCTCGQTECICFTELRQPLFIDENREVHYSAFEGGGFDAEIGSYTRVECAECGAYIYEQEKLSDFYMERMSFA